MESDLFFSGTVVETRHCEKTDQRMFICLLIGRAYLRTHVGSPDPVRDTIRDYLVP